MIARSQPTPGRVAYKQAGDVDTSLAKQVEELLAMEDTAVPEGNDAKYTTANKGQAEAAIGCACHLHFAASYTKHSNYHDAMKAASSPWQPFLLKGCFGPLCSS
jgi:hypothetical protein